MSILNPFATVAGALALSATMATAQEQDTHDCFGMDTESVMGMMFDEKQASRYRDLAGQIDDLKGCEGIANDLYDVADIRDLNQALRIVDYEILDWNNQGRPTPYPTGFNISQLNTLLGRLIADEDFIVDDGLYIGTATSLLDFANSLLDFDSVRPLVELKGNENLFNYIRELKETSPEVDRAHDDYLSSHSNYAMGQLFFTCVYVVFNDNLRELKTEYQTAKLRQKTQLSRQDPIIATTGICAESYQQVDQATREELRQNFEGILNSAVEPISYTPEYQQMVPAPETATYGRLDI